jgi:hypothetical protein
MVRTTLGARLGALVLGALLISSCGGHDGISDPALRENGNAAAHMMGLPEPTTTAEAEAAIKAYRDQLNDEWTQYTEERDYKRFDHALCGDGWISHADGAGACSSHGGVAREFYVDTRTGEPWGK